MAVANSLLQKPTLRGGNYWPQTASSEPCTYCSDVASLYCAFHQTTSSACCFRFTQVKLFWSCTSPPNTSGFTYHLILPEHRLSATKSKELGRINGVALARANGTVGNDSILPVSSRARKPEFHKALPARDALLQRTTLDTRRRANLPSDSSICTSRCWPKTAMISVSVPSSIVLWANNLALAEPPHFQVLHPQVVLIQVPAAR